MGLDAGIRRHGKVKDDLGYSILNILGAVQAQSVSGGTATKMNLDRFQKQGAVARSFSNPYYSILDILGVAQARSASGGADTKIHLDRFQKKGAVARYFSDPYYSISDILGAVQA